MANGGHLNGSFFSTFRFAVRMLPQDEWLALSSASDEAPMVSVSSECVHRLVFTRALDIKGPTFKEQCKGAEGFEIWMVPQRPEHDPFLAFFVYVAKEGEWMPLGLDASRDGVACERIAFEVGPYTSVKVPWDALPDKLKEAWSHLKPSGETA